jgi:HlyD family secretion protein
MSRRVVIRLLIAVAVVAAAVVIKLTVFATPPLSVSVATATTGTVEATVTNTRAGTVKARQRAKLSPEIGGRVAAIPHRRGERVAAGDVVLRLDDAAQRAALALAERDVDAAAARQAEACLAAEQAERERIRAAHLAAESIVAADAMDRARSAAEVGVASCNAARAGVERARANRDLARVDLARTVLRAPFDAVVAELSIEVGEWTTPSPPAMALPAVVDLIDPASLYVVAPMDEVDSGRLRPGQPARVTVDSRPGERFAGAVLALAPYVLDREEQNRTVEVEVSLGPIPSGAGAAPPLLPGTSADVEVILDSRAGVLHIPTSAILEGGKVLLVGADGVLVERTITIGLRNWDVTEVRAGLAAGDRVVTSLDRPEVKAGAQVEVR